MKTKKNIILASFIILLVSCSVNQPDAEIVNLDQASISSIAFDNTNSMWVGTSTGLYKSISGGFENLYFDNSKQINTLKYDNATNVLWIGTNNGLSKLINLGKSNETSEKILSTNLSSDIIQSIYIDANSANWVGGQIGLSRNFNDVWQKSNFKKNKNGTISPLSSEAIGINSIASWDGDYYIATNGRYLVRCSGWDETVDAFSGATTCQAPWNGGSISDTMNVVFVDSKQNQWMAGNNGIQMHTGHDSKANITEYNNGNENLFDNLRVHAIAEAPNGNIWIGTENGIYIFNSTMWTKSTATLPNQFVTAIAFDSTGKAWIGTKKGITSI